MKNEKFASRISELRKEKALSQKELGEMLGVSNKAVSKWETGEAMPQMKTIVKMAEFFNLSPDELLTGTRFDNQPTEADASISKEFGELKNENRRLKNDLHGANEKNKKVFVISTIICVVFAVAALLLGLYFTGQSDENPNNKIKSIGKEGTVIEFCGERYVPVNSIEKQMFDDYDYYNEKYATFIDENKNECKILIILGVNTDCVCVMQKDIQYLYINEKKRVKLTGKESKKNKDNKDTNDSEKSNDSKDIIMLEFYSMDKMPESFDPSYVINDDEGLDYFFKYYNEKKEPKNSTDLTKLYFNNKAKVIKVLLDDLDKAEIGVVFEDDKGNLYYYDFLTAKTYKMGDKLYEYTEKR